MTAQTPYAFLLFTVIAAFVAATAAGASAALALPVWTMFIGWVAFYPRGITARAGLVNLGCVALGLALGIGAGFALGALSPVLGLLTLPAVVFVVALIAVSLRVVPGMNNLLCIFLGLITWFAAHREPSVGAFLTLVSAAAIGSFAGWSAHVLQKRLISATT